MKSYNPIGYTMNLFLVVLFLPKSNELIRRIGTANALTKNPSFPHFCWPALPNKSKLTSNENIFLFSPSEQLRIEKEKWEISSSFLHLKLKRKICFPFHFIFSSTKQNIGVKELDNIWPLRKLTLLHILKI